MSIECPKCGVRAAGTGSGEKAYCAQCGWNVQATAVSLRKEMRGFWAAACIGVVLALVAWLRGPYGFQGALMIASAFVLFPVSFALLARFSLNKILRMKTADYVPTPVPAIRETTSSDALGKYSNASSAPPRPVRLSWRGWLYSIGISLPVAAFILLLKLILGDATGSFGRHPVKTWFALLAIGCYSWFCIRYILNRWTEWDLLAGGKFARGFVLQQEVPWRSLPCVVYCFRDVLGHEFRNRVTDFSHGLYEEMPVSVFYKEDDPTQSVALESSIFRIG